MAKRKIEVPTVLCKGIMEASNGTYCAVGWLYHRYGELEGQKLVDDIGEKLTVKRYSTSYGYEYDDWYDVIQANDAAKNNEERVMRLFVALLAAGYDPVMVEHAKS